jgi:hypothetical protein
LSMLQLIYQLDFLTLAIGNFALMMLALEGGYRLARRSVAAAPAPDHVKSGVGFAVTGMLGLMAFMLSLTISVAQGRFDARREIAIAEANAIGTAYLRAQAIGGEHGATIMRLLPDYTRLRIDFLGEQRAPAETEAIHARTAALQQQMWAAAGEIARRDSGPVTALLLQALNDVFDQSQLIRNAYESRVPLSIVGLLFVASLLSIGSIGNYFGLAGVRYPVTSTLLILLWVLCFVLIVDLDRPRSGTIQVAATALTWTLQGFAPTR